MKYWLFKSEPTCYSIDDLARDTKENKKTKETGSKKIAWTGVRNYQARNFMREMSVGDQILYYHSSTGIPAVVGLAKVVSYAHPDLTALDKKDDHYDPKATPEKPIWESVDIEFVKKFKTEIPLTKIKFDPDLANMTLAQRGSRLSIQPVLEKHFKKVVALGTK